MIGTSSARGQKARAAMAVGAALACLPLAGRAQSGADDSTGTGMATASIATGIPQPLHERPGDPRQGRAIVASRQRGLCLLCHRAPIPEERFQGDIGPDLAGAGDRWTSAQLRLRLADPQRLNPGSLMPSYFRTDHLRQVAPAWRGRTVLAADEIEDVIAYLASLRSTTSAEAAR